MDRHFLKKSSHCPPRILQCTSGSRYTCFYCKLSFPCEGSLYVHLTTLRHLGLPDSKFRMDPEFMCTNCGAHIPQIHTSKHVCVEKAFRNYWELVRFIDEFGSPNMCLLCRGKVFETPAHLNVHILISHRWKDYDGGHRIAQLTSKNPKLHNKIQCPICLSIFITQNMLVLQHHIFDVHAPEIGITMLISLSGFSRAKYGSTNDLKQWIAKRIYSCNFPNFWAKLYPVNTFKHINRLLPAFAARFCTETFTSLFNLSAHLCSFHFVDEVTKTIPLEAEMTANQQREEYERRFCLMQQEMQLCKRTLLTKKIIIDKIPASQYCLQCFRLYQTNLELQVHYMVFHLNLSWHICGICSYDCKLSLGLPNQIELPETIERSSVLLWNALWNHERRHFIFFEELARNPFLQVTEQCLLEFPSHMKTNLEPMDILPSRNSIDNLKLYNPSFIFSMDQIATLMDLGKQNTRKQTESMIYEILTEQRMYNFIGTH